MAAPKKIEVLFEKPSRPKAPAVSVVIPTLNEEKYLQAALDSIAGQRRAPDFEIVISDGGSTDRTIEIAKKYADLIVFEPIRTVGAGRNTGMFAGRGRILVGANADTIYDKEWLERLIKPFEKQEVVATMGRVVPLDGDIIDNVFASCILHPLAYVLAKLGMHYVDSSSMAVRADVFRKVGGFDMSWVSGEDTELLKRMKRHGRLVYAHNSVARISMRRIRKWGKVYFVYFHTTNFLQTHIFRKSHGNYEPIRE